MPRLLRRNRGNDDTAESEENGATAPAIEAVARMASAAAAGSAAEPGIAAADAAANAAAASFARGRKRKKSSGNAAAGENEGGARYVSNFLFFVVFIDFLRGFRNKRGFFVLPVCSYRVCCDINHFLFPPLIYFYYHYWTPPC